MVDKTVSIYDFIDVHDIDHLEAWKHFQLKGSWPQKFWDDNFADEKVNFADGWELGVASKIADRWIQLQAEDTETFQGTSYMEKNYPHIHVTGPERNPDKPREEGRCPTE